MDIESALADTTGGPLVFMGGTCPGPAWRERLAGQVSQDFRWYNPVVSEWTTEIQELELRVRAKADILLYVITPYQIGAYSFFEIAEDVLKSDKTVVVGFLPSFEDKAFNEQQWSSLMAAKKLLLKYKNTVFTSMEELVDWFNNCNINNPGSQLLDPQSLIAKAEAMDSEKTSRTEQTAPLNAAELVNAAADRRAADFTEPAKREAGTAAAEESEGGLDIATESLTVSAEGLFSSVDKWNDKADKWSKDTTRRLKDLRRNLKGNAEASIKLKGLSGDLVAEVKSSTQTLVYLLDRYPADLAQVGKRVADIVHRLNSGRANYDKAALDISAIRVPLPRVCESTPESGDFDKRWDATDVLVGGKQLALLVAGTDSDAKIVTTAGSESVTCSTDELRTVLDHLEDVIFAVSSYTHARQKVADRIDAADTNKSYLAAIPVIAAVGIFMTVGMPLAALGSAAATYAINSEYRRSLVRLFSSDEQGERVDELKACSKLTQLAGDVAMQLVDEILDVVDTANPVEVK